MAALVLLVPLPLRSAGFCGQNCRQLTFLVLTVETFGPLKGPKIDLYRLHLRFIFCRTACVEFIRRVGPTVKSVVFKTGGQRE